MSLKFGKLMQQADKNYQQVSGKLEKIDVNGKIKSREATLHILFN